jgi:hypothetical protein
MVSTRAVRNALLCLVMTVALASCSRAPVTNGAGPVGSERPSDVQVFVGSRVHEYTSLKELAKASSVIAVVRATSTTTVEMISNLPFTVTTVDVVKGIRGTSAGAQLKIRQLGRVGTVAGDGISGLLESGSVYILFLTRFEFSATEVTDQYVVTGEAGTFKADGSGSYLRLDKESTHLPGAITDSDAVGVAAS